MRYVTLQGTDINVSRLSFGTASLHHLPRKRTRQDLLAAAFEHGFTHFDTAPYYGFGIAEDELGRFLTRRRGRVSVATKIGLYSPAGSDANTASIWLRKLAGKMLPDLSRPIVDWSIDAAAKSLHTSLRRLAVDRIDLLLLHEPFSDAVDSEEFLDWLTQERNKGKIRAWGLAGESNRLDSWISTDHPLAMVLQVRDSLNRKEADRIINRGRSLQITYGYLASSLMSPDKPTAKQIVQSALRRNSTGSVLVSTRKPARVGELAAIAEKDGDAV